MLEDQARCVLESAKQEIVFIKAVIPAQAGIQIVNNARVTGQDGVDRVAEFIFSLDPRLREVTSDLPARWLSRMASSFINDNPQSKAG